MPKIRVLLAEDHSLVATGLRAALSNDVDLVEIVHDGRALLEAVERLSIDVIVTDISMPHLNGLDAIRQLVERRSATKIVVLTMHREPELAVEAFRSGVHGYVLKISPMEELIFAIKEAYEGRSYVTSLVAKDLITLLIEAGHQPSTTKDSPLTNRQREVLQLIAEGRTMKEIGVMLHISPRTAESHKQEIMHVLGLKTTADLVQYAMKNKLIGN